MVKSSTSFAFRNERLDKTIDEIHMPEFVQSETKETNPLCVYISIELRAPAFANGT